MALDVLEYAFHRLFPAFESTNLVINAQSTVHRGNASQMQPRISR